MTQKKLIEMYGKLIARRVTARKHGGDDAGSWAVFIDGSVFVNGLTKNSVGYYKSMACEQLKKEAVAS